MSQIGKVYLVGAGPGHPELITVKGLTLIQRADVIVYDRLVQADLLAAARPDAERVYVGKAPGRHESRQREINETLASLARRHRVVVRLKGGDPLLFGRGGEEAEHLAEVGVPFEIIPGVSASLAAPAAAGIPVTHRDMACTLAIVTGHEKDGAAEGRIDWSALARIDTLVILMGVHALPRIAEHLTACGRSADTPVALIETAYWAGERVLTATLGTMAEAAALASIKPPTTLVVGEVARLHARLGTAAVRELKATASATQPVPGPAAGELARFADAIRNGRRLKVAIDLALFDDLEEPRSPAELAARHGLDAGATGELLGGLVQARLLLAVDDRLRNGELASRFLRRGSPTYLGAQLLEELSAAVAYDPLADLVRLSKKRGSNGHRGVQHDAP